MKQVETQGRVRWAFTVDGRFVSEAFDPTWGLTTYDSPAEALAAGKDYLKKKV